MKLTEEVEFENEDGTCYYKDVEFEAEPEVCNDSIGSYEYWGQKCYDHQPDYVSTENNGGTTWDETLYTKNENEVISKFVDDYVDNKMCDKFCEVD